MTSFFRNGKRRNSPLRLALFLLSASILLPVHLLKAQSSETTFVYTSNPFAVQNGPFGYGAPNPAWGDYEIVTVTLDVGDTYTGTVGSSDLISGDIEVLDSSNDPLFTLATTNTNDSFTLNSITFDAGVPQNWNISAIDAYGSTNDQAGTVNVDSPSFYQNDFATTSTEGQGNSVPNDPGTWSTQAVPEPGEVGLLGLAVGGLVLLRRSKRHCV